MTDDTVDLRFLGRQVQILQVDVKDIRASEMRRDAEVAALRADLARMEADTHAKFEQVDDRFDRLETRLDRIERSIDARFEQAHKTMATNLQVVLAAIAGINKTI